MSWPMVRLKDIGEIVTGHTPSKDDPDNFGSDIPFVSPSELGKCIYVENAKQSLSKKGGKLSRLLPKNSVMVCCIGSLGKVGITGTELATNQQINSIIINEKVADYLYVYFYCLTLKDTLEAMAPVTTVAIVNKSRFSELKIPLPPLPIQKQIAAVLEKADTLRQQCQQMEQELNALAQAVFLEMFGDPIKNPKNWAKKRIRDLVKDFIGGKSLASAETEENSGAYRVLKISAVTTGEFKPEESKPLPDDYTPRDEHYVKANNLLISRANTTELVGATALVFGSPENLLLPDKLWRFVWHDSAAISQVFYWQLLSSKGLREQLGKISSGSGGSMKNISKGKLNELEVIYPPIEIQLEYERVYLQIRQQKQTVSEQLIVLNDNFNSLMQRAFKGELDLATNA